ncbi:MAG: ribosome biogenesis GTPase Der [Candidatus Korobacteraceae bacterium]
MSRRVQFESSKAERQGEPPVAGTLAIVGRPNVGKSTLFNRLVGSRRAIVGDEPGITRDRIYGEAEWAGRTLRVVDTGGIVPDDQALIPAEIFRQARVALDEADAIVLVVDGRTELAAPDIDLARLLLRTGKPLLLAVNKVDTVALEPYAEEFRRLGIKQLFPISAENGNGLAELLDHALSVMPAREGSHQPPATSHELEARSSELEPESSELEAQGSQLEASRETKVAIIGRPNVGKSTLLNALTGTARAIVSPVAGTTRDAVDELVEHGGQSYRFIDTAGIRRKGKTELMAEKLSVVMARKHLEAADVALMVIDAVEGVTASDATIAGYAHESGRSVIVVINKWDLVTTNRSDGKPPAERSIYEEQVRRHLKFLSYAPVVFVSATTGKNINKLFATLELVARERRKRVGTGEMNRFLSHVDFERASVPMAKRVKIYYMTQAAVSPPTFILFTDRAVKLHFSYQRFLENQIRAAFGFVGTPIWIKNRARNKPRGKK